MLEKIFSEIRNYFDREIWSGTFKIESGVLSPSDFIKENQYFRIVGSSMNDGIYQSAEAIESKIAKKKVDEEFNGEIWILSPPAEIIELADKIEAYEEKNGDSAFVSESFGGYSYTKATDSNGVAVTWQDVFGKKLNKWRKI